MDKLPTIPFESIFKTSFAKMRKEFNLLQNFIYVTLFIFLIVVGESIIKKALYISLYFTLIIACISISNVIIKSNYFPSTEFNLANQKAKEVMTKVRNVVKVAID